MNIKTILLAMIIVVITVFSTTVSIPSGYTAITNDGKSLYSEGLHPLQTHPFEYIQLTKLSHQCDKYGYTATLNDDDTRINVKLDVCWRVARDIKQISDLNDVYGGDKQKIFANPTQDLARFIFDMIEGKKTDDRYHDNYAMNLILVSGERNVLKNFQKFNTSNLTLNGLSINRMISAEMRNELTNKGILISSVTITFPDFKPFDDAIKKRNETQKIAEAEVRRLQEKANAMRPVNQ